MPPVSATRHLRESYRRCRAINARDGKTFFLATRLLAPRQRPAVHALYGFARRADDILDDFDAARDVDLRAQQLQQLSTQLFNTLVEKQPCGDDPTLAAVVHTARKYDIGWDLFDDFLASMRMDLTVTDYPDRRRAGALHVRLGGGDRICSCCRFWAPSAPREDAAPHAAALGKAFQLTNFIRDVDEDLRRGRVYLPADELAAHGVDRDLLVWCQTNRRTDPRVRRALVGQHAIARGVYAQARAGIAMLRPASRPCVAAALTLYSEILERIEEIDFEIFSQRATVGNPRRLAVAAAGITRAWGARLRHGSR